MPPEKPAEKTIGQIIGRDRASDYRLSEAAKNLRISELRDIHLALMEKQSDERSAGGARAAAAAAEPPPGCSCCCNCEFCCCCGVAVTPESKHAQA
jgi:hypothetical protein